MTSIFVVGSVLKIAASLGIGLGASTMFSAFHNYEFKSKKKGDNHDNHGSILRERAKGLS